MLDQIRKVLTTRTRAIHAARNRPKEQFAKLEALWGKEIAEAVQGERGNGRNNRVPFKDNTRGRPGVAQQRGEGTIGRCVARANRLYVNRLLKKTKREDQNEGKIFLISYSSKTL